MTIQQRSSALVVAFLALLPLFLTACRGPHLGERFGSGTWSCGGLIVLILAIYAIVNILQSDADSTSKLLWTLLVFFLPLLGFIIWLIAGPRKP